MVLAFDGVAGVVSAGMGSHGSAELNPNPGSVVQGMGVRDRSRPPLLPLRVATGSRRLPAAIAVVSIPSSSPWSMTVLPGNPVSRVR